MRLVLASITAACLAFAANPAAAQQAEVYAALETIYGTEQADLFDDYFEVVKQGFAERDLELLSSLGSYPFEVAANGELYDIFEPGDFSGNFDALLLPETIDAIANQEYSDLIVTDEGVGFANGALWLGNVCEDDTCTTSNWLITRINN
jgi:hypothetical protein